MSLAFRSLIDRKVSLVFMVLILFVPWASQANAQQWTGDGDGSSWNDAGNWDTGSVPGVDDFAIIFTPTGFPFPFDVNVNQSTAAGLVVVENSSLNVNSDFGGELGVAGGAFNLNSGTLTGGLSLGSVGFFGDTEAAEFNRNGGVLALDSLSLGEVSNSVSLLNGDSITSVSVNDGGVVDLDGAAITESLLVGELGTLNLNSGSISGVQNVDGGTLNLVGGTLSGEFRISENIASGANPTLTRSGTVLDLLALDLGGDVSLSIDATDNVRGAIDVSENAELTINRDLTLERLVNSNNSFTNGSLVAREGSVVNLNADIVDSELVEYHGNSLQRANGVSITTTTLVVNSANYAFDGTDTITGSVRIDDGSLEIDQDPANFNFTIDATGSTVSINTESLLGKVEGGQQSTININEATDVDDVLTVDETSVLNINADLTAGTTNGTIASGGTINLNNGMLGGRLQLFESVSGSGAVFNRANGTILDLFGLRIDGETHLDLMEVDTVANSILLSNGASVDAFTALDLLGTGGLTLASDSDFSFFQADGQLDGLSLSELQIDGTSILNLSFDDLLAEEDQLDFALRLSGDQVSDLESLLASGQVLFSSPDSISVEVIRDTNRFGNFTYLGYVGVAVPEPTAFPLLLAFAATALGARRRGKV